MSKERYCILIVEDQEINRQILKEILKKDYDVQEASNGEEAFKVLETNHNMSAILLDLLMPIMDGYTFLDQVKTTPYANIPIIAVTGEQDEITESKVLKLGAWDLITKPYQPAILLTRIQNAIIRSQYYLLNEMKYLYERDPLTDFYNRTKFFAEARNLINSDTKKIYSVVRIDINDFHVINSFYGAKKGDEILKFLADNIEAISRENEPTIYGRISGDVFAVCGNYSKEQIIENIARINAAMAKFGSNFSIKVKVGVCVIENNEENIESSFEKAAIAASTIKKNIAQQLVFYQKEMSVDLLLEQEIIGEMQQALNRGEFELYLQPKYNLKTNLPYGAEVLVRWNHPKKGLLSPAFFVPIFEKYGFIEKLDSYVWNKAAELVSRWKNEGKNPAPISVNVSRIDLYNKNFVQNIQNIINKYNINPAHFNLEITESAYMDNPEIIDDIVKKLQSIGLIIMMDDFGSGYSSLNILKDIPIDVLKIDNKFLSGRASETRKNIILASIIQIASWLKIPVIMEGVETISQVEFLKSVGCNYIQGYFYAKPMKVKNYEDLVANISSTPASLSSDNHDLMVRSVWDSDSPTSLVFNSIKDPLAIYEVSGGFFRVIRTNDAFRNLYNAKTGRELYDEKRDNLQKESYRVMLEAFNRCAKNESDTYCEYIDIIKGVATKIRLELQYWGRNENSIIVLGTIKM